MTFGMLLLLLILGNLLFMILAVLAGLRRPGEPWAAPDVRWGLRAVGALVLVMLAAYGWWALTFPYWGEDDQFIACAKEYGLHCLRAAIGYGPMSWRPVQRLSVLTDLVLWGESIPGKNFQNLFLFFASAVSVSLLAYRLFSDRTLALWAAIVFLLFPVHASVVTRIDQRGNPLCLIFSLLSLSFFLKYWDTRRLPWLAVASSSALLALLSKETALLLPAWAGLMLVLRLKGALRLTRELALSVLAFGLPWLAVLVMRSYHYEFQVWIPTGTITLRSFGPTMAAYVSELLFPFFHTVLPLKFVATALILLWIGWEIARNRLLADWRYVWLLVVTVLTMAQFAYVAPVDIRIGFLLNRLYIVMGFFAILLTALLLHPRAAAQAEALRTYRRVALLALVAGYTAQLVVNRTLVLQFK